MTELTAAEIEELLENHPWQIEGYTYTPYSYGYGYGNSKASITVPDHTQNISGSLPLPDGTRHEVSWDSWEETNKQYPEEVAGLGIVYCIDQVGGEDQGSSYFIVLQIDFPDGSSRTFKKDGWYASHDGSYLDGEFSEVAQKKKVIKVWA